ncbi:TetR/AcrR family transcriptional regulator [Lentzea sp. CC55]|uniref:TetR/AcrR family transcriptional regulator n=1 Tax=Lentzea sp. CC55 TaxID=2884909 RepID=UPI001F3221ED|nr:TetR/AcrR family transcriptional regulator [Lentzea sp. CC55]MCG8925169.1 TetR/AcrR family transcriptional regulator [Lentzea sp. CC55]
MGRTRQFDEDTVVRAAVELFATRAYDGISVDDLVTHLGVHRNSLYKTFGSKKGLYLVALRRHADDHVRPLAEALAGAAGLEQAARLITAAPLDLLLVSAVERAPHDPEVAEVVARAFGELDRALAGLLPAPLASAFTAALLGVRLRARATGPSTEDLAAALADRLGK